MIQARISGHQLLDEINAARPVPGQLFIWWLGQSGYAIRTASHLMYFDLYLSEHLTQKYAGTNKPHDRMMAAPLRGHQINNADLVFCSHKHSDHFDPVTMPELMAASPAAKLLLPRPVLEHAQALGIASERLIAVDGDGSVKLGDMVIHGVPGAHPDFAYDAQSGYPFLGFIIKVDGCVIYHSGDTLRYDGLAERLSSFEIDLAILPINGTTEKLLAMGTPPNMSAADAVMLAQQVRPGLTIPCHYDMFYFNTVDVADFVTQAEAADIPFAVLEVAERFVWQP